MQVLEDIEKQDAIEPARTELRAQRSEAGIEVASSVKVKSRFDGVRRKCVNAADPVSICLQFGCEVSGGLPPGDGDGVIGAAMFQRFLIRFNAGERLLELLPFPDTMEGPFEQERPWHGHDRMVAPGMEGFTKAHQVGHLLLVPAKINQERFGYFLLDTGAAFSSLSLELARWGSAHSNVIAVSGLSGRASSAVRVSPVEFHFARRPLVDMDPIAIDLREMSRQLGVEISGLIGYPAISRQILTIDYRNGLIDIAPRR